MARPVFLLELNSGIISIILVRMFSKGCVVERSNHAAISVRSTFIPSVSGRRKNHLSAGQ